MEKNCNKLRLVSKRTIFKPIRRKVLQVFNNALKRAQDEEWRDIIIIGRDKEGHSIVHSQYMNDDILVATLERAKHFILTTDRIE